MTTAFRLLDKADQRTFSRKFGLTGNIFNTIVEVAKEQALSEEQMSSYVNRILRCNSHRKVLFSAGENPDELLASLTDDLSVLVACAIKRQAAEKEKLQIVAEADGKATLDELREMFPYIRFTAVFRKKNCFWLRLRLGARITGDIAKSTFGSTVETPEFFYPGKAQMTVSPDGYYKISDVVAKIKEVQEAAANVYAERLTLLSEYVKHAEGRLAFAE